MVLKFDDSEFFDSKYTVLILKNNDLISIKYIV